MYKLEKLTDDVFEGEHPNGVLSGMSWVGHIGHKPRVGQRFHFGIQKDRISEHLLTSTVIEIVDEETFKTRNSTYKLTKHESD